MPRNDRIPRGFPAELIKPMPKMRRGLGLTPTGKKPIPSINQAGWGDEYVRRLELLAKHYKVVLRDDRDFKNLLFKVLHDWIPGFRDPVPSRRGRPRDDRHAKHAWEQRLRSEVDKMRAANKSLNDKSACEKLAGPQGKNHEFRGIKSETLRKKLHAAREAHKHYQELVEKWGLAFVTDRIGIEGD